MKRQPSEWEKIFANKANDKGFISKIFKRAHTAQYQKDKQPNQKMGRKKKEKGQKTYIGISPKKTYRWPRGT